MTALIVAFALSFVVSIAVENRPMGLLALRAPWRALLIRATLHLAFYSAAFSLSWRPWHAAFVVCAVALLFGAGSAMKRRIIGEPVVFSDFALVRNAIRHPRLYYAERLAEPRALALFAALGLATVLWFALEAPSPRPSSWWMLAIPPLVCAGAVVLLRSAHASAAATALVGSVPHLEGDIARFGLGGAMTLQWLAWRAQERPSPAARAAMEERRPQPPAGPKIVVAIQCESFVDIGARGTDGPDLPGYRALAQEAVAWGRCRTAAAEGAYTMRTEFSFLTGLPRETLGFDVFDPYLAHSAYARASIARHLKASGWRTVFIHPYDRRFFARDELIPDFGFDRFVDGEAFADAERFGPYVTDAAVADMIAAEVAAADAPTFLFAVTIENHGPWGPGRIPGVDGAAEQYALHLQNADRMIASVAETLRTVAGGAVLAIYGDHAPARTIYPDLPHRTSADYLLWDSRELRQTPSSPHHLEIDAVGRMLMRQVAGSDLLPRERSDASN